MQTATRTETGREYIRHVAQGWTLVRQCHIGGLTAWERVSGAPIMPTEELARCYFDIWE